MQTRIELTTLDKGRFQWKLWSDDRLVESAVGTPETLDTYLRSAALLLLPVGSEAPLDPRWDFGTTE